MGHRKAKLDEWWRISGPRWTFGIHAVDGVVTEAAPISKWAIGKPLEVVIDWWLEKGAESVVLLRKRPEAGG